MNHRLAAIEARRAMLLERVAREREQVAQTLQSWAPPLAFIDRCVLGVRFVVSRPPVLAGAALVLVLLRPRTAFKLARRAFGLWQGYRWLWRKVEV